MVTVFVVFMLLKREDLRNRLIHLIGGEQLNLTTQALNDAASRVSRYLLMQLIINSSYGLVICAGLTLIGLPNALLWGADGRAAICAVCWPLDRGADAHRDFARGV